MVRLALCLGVLCGRLMVVVLVVHAVLLLRCGVLWALFWGRV